MTVDEGRKAYATIMVLLKKERHMRDTFLGEPRRTQALAEVDGAISSLESLGAVLAQAALAGVLTSGDEQQPLIDVPPARKQYL